MIEELTKREKEVIKLIAYGLTNEQIAKKMFVSESTIKSHTAEIYSKFGLTKSETNPNTIVRLQAVLIYLKDKGYLKDEYFN